MVRKSWVERARGEGELAGRFAGGPGRRSGRSGAVRLARTLAAMSCATTPRVAAILARLAMKQSRSASARCKLARMDENQEISKSARCEATYSRIRDSLMFGVSVIEIPHHTLILVRA